MRSTTHDEHTTPRPAPAGARRGIALMLVVVTLGMATVLTTSFVMSRENTPQIATAAQDRVRAEWSARSAADLVQAVMETHAEWKPAANAGALIKGMSWNGAVVSVAITDLEGGTVEDDETSVLMTVTASAGGVETVVQRVMIERETGTYEQALDPQLSEFGVFAIQRVELDASAKIGLWPLSPSVRAGEKGKLGVGFDSAAGLSVPSDSMPYNGSVYTPPGSGLSLEAALSGQNVTANELPVRVWTTALERPASMSGLPDAPGSRFLGMPIDVDIYSDGPVASGYYGRRLRIQNANVEFDAAGGPISVEGEPGPGDSLRIENSVVRIKGDVEIMVMDDLEIKDSAIILEDGATLTVYVGEDVDIDDSIINTEETLLSESSRRSDDIAAWSDPRRVRFLQLNEAAPEDEDDEVVFRVHNRSLIVGSVHAPMSHTLIENDSAVLGRLTSRQLEMKSNARLLLDPAFDNKMGLTEPGTSPLYDENGDPVAGLADALAATTETEGAAAAKARLLASLPPLAIPSTDPDEGGATPRDGASVTVTRDWPVMVRAQEKDESRPVLFAAPQNETIATDMGRTVKGVHDVAKGAGAAAKSIPQDVLDTLADVLGPG